MKRPRKPQLLERPPRNAGLFDRFWWAVFAPVVVAGGLGAYLIYFVQLVIWKVMARVAPEVWDHPRLNGSQAERFLDLLKWVRVEEWQKINGSVNRVRAAYGWYRFDIALAGLMAIGGRKSERLLKAVEERIPVETHDSRHNASIAALSLALAGELTDAQVIAGYAPFAETIPIGELGPGRAPVVEPPPSTTWGRFVSRLRALEGSEQQQVVRLAYAVESAVGVDEINRAIALQDLAEHEVFMEAARDIEEFTNRGVGRLTDLYSNRLAALWVIVSGLPLTPIG